MFEEGIQQKSRGIKIIALWMFLLPLPGFYRDYQQGIEVLMSPLATLEWGFYLSGIVCAIGLLRLRPWARSLTVGLFALHFLWVLWAIYSLSGPSFNVIIANKSLEYHLSPGTFKAILGGLIPIYILWLFGVIFYLLHPQVKLRFTSDPFLSE